MLGVLFNCKLFFLNVFSLVNTPAFKQVKKMFFNMENLGGLPDLNNQNTSKDGSNNSMTTK